MTLPLPLIPTTVVGSHGQSGWRYTSVTACEASELGPGGLEPMFDDAANAMTVSLEGVLARTGGRTLGVSQGVSSRGLPRTYRTVGRAVRPPAPGRSGP